MMGIGIGDMPFVVVPHPMGGIRSDAIRAKAEVAFPAILKAATMWKPTTKLPPQKPAYPAERLEFKGTEEEINKLFLLKGWSLGLPVIPPTPERVARMLKKTSRKAGELLWEVPPRKGALTIELVATHAVMAGCKPEYMPTLIAILEAMKDPEFDWAAQKATTNPAFPLIIINGQVVKGLDIATGQGAAGAGYHPNVSMGYFVNLIANIVGGAKSPETDKSTLGQTGSIVATVIGENTSAVPSWEPLNVERGYSPETSTVTIVPVEGVRNMNIAQQDTAQGILDVVALEMETVGPVIVTMYRGEGTGDVVLLLCPQHATIIAKAGWSKRDVKEYLFEKARIPYENWRLNLRTVHLKNPWYTKFGPGDIVPVVDSPENIIVVVAGGVGTHSQYLSGYGRPVITKPIR